MVGRSSVAPLVLVIAALASAHPATAEPESLLSRDLPARPASLAAASASSAVRAIEVMVPVNVPQEASTAAATGDTAPPPSTPSDFAAADESAIVDPTEAIGAPAVAAAPAPQRPATADLRDQAPDSGELGVEYQLSVSDAASFLDRLSARFKRLVEQAMTYLGTPYRRGGTTRRGLDCSGLTGAVYGEQGLDLPRTAAQQFAEGVAVASSDLRPGDLVFFRDTYKRGISHVGIYIGDGRFLHAAGRRHGVIVSELSRPYYRSRYAGARRPATEPAAADRQASQGGQASQGTTGLAGDSRAASTLAAAPRR
jgi:cell wall-associated NlpC family hydrolase